MLSLPAFSINRIFSTVQKARKDSPARFSATERRPCAPCPTWAKASRPAFTQSIRRFACISA